MSSTRYGKRFVAGSGLIGQQWPLHTACTASRTAISILRQGLVLAVKPIH